MIRRVLANLVEMAQHHSFVLLLALHLVAPSVGNNGESLSGIGNGMQAVEPRACLEL